MESFVIFLVMFATIIGLSLAIGAALLGVPITLLVLAARGKKLTLKIILLSAAAVLCLPIVAEVLSLITLLVLFQIFGQG
jgi:hypothetical protein